MEKPPVTSPRILFIFGTRPEAIKLCPLVQHMAGSTQFEVRVCVTAQHRSMLDQVLATFGVTPDYDLATMRPGQSLSESTSRMLGALEAVLQAESPDMILVQGDTTTTLCGALSGFYLRIPVGHVEAGLRTGDMAQPFPEEMNRVLVSRLSTLHFAATQGAARNLREEGISEDRIVITGNTGIDAVLQVAEKLQAGAISSSYDWSFLRPERKLIVVTAHRRESFGEAFEHICTALEQLALRPDIRIVYPVHPNPNVTEPVRRRLGSNKNVVLTEPLDYTGFVDLMRRAWLLLTDSGGIQEEGPSLGKPVVVMRETTERPEAVAAGTALLAGSSTERILQIVERLLDDPAEYEHRSRMHNPYGDGHASERIAQRIRTYFN